MVITNDEIQKGMLDEIADFFAVLNSMKIGSDLSEKGLMPYLNVGSIGARSALPSLETCFDEGYDPELKNGVRVYPELSNSQKGVVGFDLKVNGFIGKSDVVMDNVSEKDLMDMEHVSLDEGEEYILYPNSDGQNVYYIKTLERVVLGSGLELILDSKSTSARLGCMTHLAGFTQNGELILCVQPFSFPIKIRANKSCLSQAVVRYKNSPYMANPEILSSQDIRFQDDKSLIDLLNPHGLLMRFMTKIAYRAKTYNDNMPPIDIDSENGTIDFKEYFDLIDGGSHITADRKTLYLLGSKGVVELLAVCGFLSRESGVLTGTGAWSHMAGIVQPFWKGGLTMEFYSHEKRRIVDESGAGYMRFDKIVGEYKKPEDSGSYQGQIPPRLAKIFKNG